MTDSNESASEWRPLCMDMRVREFAADPSSGPLLCLHQPTVTSVRGRVLIALSASTGVPPNAAGDVLRQAVAELLDRASKASASMILETLQREVWGMFQDGRFDRGVPEIMAVVAGQGGKLHVWRAGPNGIAVAEDGRVRLVSEDLRMAALQRLGASLDQRWTEEPLLAEVSELTQIEPPGSSCQELTVHLSDKSCLLLMSRGAMPFAASSEAEATDEWWGRDAGWRHGLGATVVAIVHDGSTAEGADAVSPLKRLGNAHSRTKTLACEPEGGRPEGGRPEGGQDRGDPVSGGPLGD